ncbi:hypothetical protein CEXT_240731 [Caerostris extrusa]|uniref:Uncharacterized protein n=1 Tax=Caerostris extrusa TaxID=172846 RepID=A0AAV4TEV5_CAEEX|nr:hypothetical protein CEXT_240731 [Caerostris extrusa]
MLVFCLVSTARIQKFTQIRSILIPDGGILTEILFSTKRKRIPRPVQCTCQFGVGPRNWVWGCEICPHGSQSLPGLASSPRTQGLLAPERHLFVALEPRKDNPSGKIKVHPEINKYHFREGSDVQWENCSKRLFDCYAK